MNRKLAVFAMLIATTFFWLPADSNPVSAQNRQNKSEKRNKGKDGGLWQPDKHGKGWNNGRKDAHGYRNYGQYRRTKVGNRRFRLARRYYWQNGTRLSRLTRVYY